MAVYTVLDREEVEAFIAPYGIGPLLSFEGVAAGVENSNYFISTDASAIASELHTNPKNEYVLTIFEEIAAADLLFYARLTTMLNGKGLPVPCPIRDADGEAVHYVQGKPAMLVPKVKGEHPQLPSQGQCQAIGSALARCHLACLGWPESHAGNRDFPWLKRTAQTMASQLAPDEKELLKELPHFEQQLERHPDLPKAVIHGDLFRDNALFEGDTLTGLIDFNSAGEGFLLMDLAVVINDWCSRPDGSLDTLRSDAILETYRQIRPVTADEQQLWGDFLRIAALRFWVSRRYTQLNPTGNHRPGGLVVIKDPQQFRDILAQRIRYPQILK